MQNVVAQLVERKTEDRRVASLRFLPVESLYCVKH